MFLHELLTGNWPWATTDASAPEIPEKISLGDRPSLDSGCSMTRFVELIEKSWRQAPHHRPTATQIVGEMKKASFVAQHLTLSVPCGNVIHHICSAVDHLRSPPVHRLMDSRQQEMTVLLNSRVGTEEIRAAATENCDVKHAGIIWGIGSSGRDRRLTIVNAETGRCQLKETAFPGKSLGSLT